MPESGLINLYLKSLMSFGSITDEKNQYRSASIINVNAMTLMLLRKIEGTQKQQRQEVMPWLITDS